MLNLIELQNDYKSRGFIILREIFDKILMDKIYKEIIESKNSIKYFDRQNKLRRIEQLFDKGINLKKLNDQILLILKSIFKEEYTIFKDKYNAKPPGGEGFYPHYDGIFIWVDKDGNENKGWHKYANNFVNVLVAIDSMNLDNGPLEIANSHNEPFEVLLNRTKKNGTPDINPEIEKKLNFEKILLSVGDIVIFSSKCPHRSSKNNSSIDRRTIYYTYNALNEGNFYDQYFRDKNNSKNIQSKSLSGEI